MLPKKNRLTKRKEFNYIFKNGKNFSTKLFVLNYIPTKLPNFKVGFSVSKKVGNAVVRNRTKRRMREAFKQIQTQIDKNYNYIFVARKNANEATLEEIKKTFTYSMQKCNLIKRTKND
jgi:ribonuclease P protein component